MAFLSPTSGLKTLVAIPLAVALVGPAGIGALAARRTGQASDGTLAALWTAIVGGLLVFAIWVTATYADAGRPYDTGLVHDFKQSGATDLATYAVGDSLGSALDAPRARPDGRPRAWFARRAARPTSRLIFQPCPP